MNLPNPTRLYTVSAVSFAMSILLIHYYPSSQLNPCATRRLFLQAERERSSAPCLSCWINLTASMREAMWRWENSSAQLCHPQSQRPTFITPILSRTSWSSLHRNLCDCTSPYALDFNLPPRHCTFTFLFLSFSLLQGNHGHKSYRKSRPRLDQAGQNWPKDRVPPSWWEHVSQ